MKQKITIRVHSKLWTKFSDVADDLGLRRDAVFSRILGNELTRLHQELRGRRLSEKGKSEIRAHLKTLPLQQTSIQVSQHVADALRDVVEEHNLNRDSVINRILLFFVSPERFLDSIELKPFIEFERLSDGKDVRMSPLERIEDAIKSPFDLISETLEDIGQDGVYLVHLRYPLFGMTCYCEDSELPSVFKDLDLRDL